MKILTIIPTKLDSTRLREKNIQKINGKPMFYHSIEYAQNTKHQNKIIISSESDKVSNLLPDGVFFHKRDLSLCGDVEVVDVYLNVIKEIDENFDYVVCLQPDNPDRTNTFDECLDYIVDNNYDDGTAYWDLLSNESLEVAAGMYIYHVKSLLEGDNGSEKIGKFAIIK